MINRKYKYLIIILIAFFVLGCGKDKQSSAVNLDTAAPVITLNGKNRIEILLEEEYIEPGVYATDDVDGDVDVNITGEVNSSKAGTYYLTYSAIDSAGNIATKTRTVNVFEDITAPTIVLNGKKNITIEQLGFYNELNASATDDVDGDVDVNITGEVNSSKPGDYNITYQAVDSTGNIAIKVRTVSVEPLIIVHNKKEYGIVISPYTKKVWLDRNLGANHVCKSKKDTECYGDYYQWGRGYDGHQDASSLKISESFSIKDKNKNFVLSSKDKNWDWARDDADGVLRRQFWLKSDGSSICPDGYRVAKQQEFKDELFKDGAANVKNSKDAHNSFLKLPIAGYRYYKTGEIDERGKKGYFWTLDEKVLDISSFSANIDYGGYRANANTVRCIQK